MVVNEINLWLFMHSFDDFLIDSANFGSSSSITFPVLQRTAEEKILNLDRLTLER